MDSPKSSTKSLSSLARSELENLRDLGISLTWDQIVLINDLSRRVESPKINPVSVTGLPQKLGNLTLWPLTIQAAEWYAWLVDQFDEGLCFIGLIYAHVHSREPGAFETMYEHATAKREITALKKAADYTFGEAIEIINLLNGDVNCEAPEDPADIDDLVASLTAKTGIDPDYWRCRASLPYITKQIDAITVLDGGDSQKKIEYIAAEKALGKAILEIQNGN